MLAATLPEGIRAMFEQLLNAAITQGRRPPGNAGLGPATVSAIERVAREHPEASSSPRPMTRTFANTGGSAAGREPMGSEASRTRGERCWVDIV
ncbi:MAG TPA: hypothetical protein VE666_16530 [Mycobacterium sp.]|nr:hypothetical protein [Mycobacterium sp.]